MSLNIDSFRQMVGELNYGSVKLVGTGEGQHLEKANNSRFAHAFSIGMNKDDIANRALKSQFLSSLARDGLAVNSDVYRQIKQMLGLAPGQGDIACKPLSRRTIAQVLHVYDSSKLELDTSKPEVAKAQRAVNELFARIDTAQNRYNYNCGQVLRGYLSSIVEKDLGAKLPGSSTETIIWFNANSGSIKNQMIEMLAELAKAKGMGANDKFTWKEMHAALIAVYAGPHSAEQANRGFSPLLNALKGSARDRYQIAQNRIDGMLIDGDPAPAMQMSKSGMLAKVLNAISLKGNTTLTEEVRENSVRQLIQQAYDEEVASRNDDEGIEEPVEQLEEQQENVAEQLQQREGVVVDEKNQVNVLGEDPVDPNAPLENGEGADEVEKVEEPKVEVEKAPVKDPAQVKEENYQALFGGKTGEALLEAAKAHPQEFIGAFKVSIDMVLMVYQNAACSKEMMACQRSGAPMSQGGLERQKMVMEILLENPKFQAYVKSMEAREPGGPKVPCYSPEFQAFVPDLSGELSDANMVKLCLERMKPGLDESQVTILEFGMAHGCHDVNDAYSMTAEKLGVSENMLRNASTAELKSLVALLNDASGIDHRTLDGHNGDVNVAVGKAFAKGLFKTVDATQPETSFRMLAGLLLTIDNKVGKYNPKELETLYAIGLGTRDLQATFKAIERIPVPKISMQADDPNAKQKLRDTLNNWKTSVAAAYMANNSTLVGLSEFVERTFGQKLLNEIKPNDIVMTPGRFWGAKEDATQRDPVFANRESPEAKLADAFMGVGDLKSIFSGPQFNAFYQAIKGMKTGAQEFAGKAGGVDFTVSVRPDGSLTGTVTIGGKAYAIGVGGTADSLLQQLQGAVLRDFNPENADSMPLVKDILADAIASNNNVRELSAQLLGRMLGQATTSYQSIATNILTEVAQGLLDGTLTAEDAKGRLVVDNTRVISVSAEDALNAYRALSPEDKNRVALAPVDVQKLSPEARQARLEGLVRELASDAIAGNGNLAESHAEALAAIKDGTVDGASLWKGFPDGLKTALHEFVAAIKNGTEVADAAATLKGGAADFTRACTAKLTESIKQELDRMKAEDAQGGKPPLWKQSLAEIANASKIDFDSPYGKYIYNAMTSYFAKLAEPDTSTLLQAMVRNAEGEGDAGFLTAAFKGAGPIFQKLLQGLPQESFSANFQTALSTVKDSLGPIDRELVLAQLNKLRMSSNGEITEITVQKSLGAASVGEAFLCLVKTAGNPLGETCVVKVLRPDAAPRAAREREILLAAANEVGEGVGETMKNQFDAIDRELDLRTEADNAVVGHTIYHQKDSVGMVKSMELHESGLSTTDAVILKQAPGETLSKKFDKVMQKLATLENQARSGLGEVCQIKEQLKALYDKMVQYQSNLIGLCNMWDNELLYGSGFFHADLHAGNIMADGNGLTLIDYGNVAKMSDDERKAMIGFVAGAVASDGDYVLRGFEKITGTAIDPDLRKEIESDLKVVLKKGSGNDSGDRIAAALQVIQRRGLALPPILSSYSQGQIRLQSSLARANAIMESIAAANNTLGMDEGVDEEWPNGIFVGQMIDMIRSDGSNPSPIAVEMLAMLRKEPNFVAFEKTEDYELGSKISNGPLPPTIANLVAAARAGKGPEFDHEAIEAMAAKLTSIMAGFDHVNTMYDFSHVSFRVSDAIKIKMQHLEKFRSDYAIDQDKGKYNPSNPLDYNTKYGRDLCSVLADLAMEQVRIIKIAASFNGSDSEVAAQSGSLKYFSDCMMNAIIDNQDATLAMVDSFNQGVFMGATGMKLKMVGSYAALNTFNNNMQTATANIKTYMNKNAKALRGVPSAVTTLIPKAVSKFPVISSIVTVPEDSDAKPLDLQMQATREQLEKAFKPEHLKNKAVQQLIVNTASTLFGNVPGDFCKRLKKDLPTWFK